MDYDESPIDRLPATAWRQLRAFVAGARREALRVEDWHAYYDFVKTCHLHDADLSVEALVAHLQEHGFPQAATIELGLVYAHGRAMLGSRGG
jgi:hypothetical protein